MSDEKENQRYVEYLQRQLVRGDSEDYLDGLKEWFKENRVAISERYRELESESTSRARTLADAVLIHEDQGDYDFFLSRQIFEPLLAKTLKICQQSGIAPELPVKFANSPGVDPSPTALPSMDEHILFAGPGTFAFCNYWSKIFSTALYEVGQIPRRKQKNLAVVLQKLRSGQVLIDATHLAVHYAMSRSLLGYGKLDQSEELHRVRVMLVNSMEVFIVAHEVGHFVGHEEHPETRGIPPDSDSKQHELECDAIGLAVCTAYGVEENNPFAFQLIGPLLFFYALRICEETESILTGVHSGSSESHPSTDERIRFILQFLKEVGANKAVHRSVNDALEIAMIIGSQVLQIVREVNQSEAVASETKHSSVTQ